MKRIAILAVTLVTAAVCAGSVAASDTRGPACANIIAGDFGYSADTGAFGGTMTLAAAACSDYELDIYDASGTTLLQHLSGTVDPNDSTMTTISFSTTVSSGLSGVCIVGTSSWKGHVADVAPNSGCFFVEAGGAGGGQFN
jgi:hypothetical protein